MNIFFRILKSLIDVFKQILFRARILGVNVFQKLKFFGRLFFIRGFEEVKFLNNQFVKFSAGSWKILAASTILKVLLSHAFIINLSIALFIELLLITVPYHENKYFPNFAKPLSSHIYGWICEKEDLYMDWMMKMYKGNNLKEEQHKAHSFVWLNIDKFTHDKYKWDELSYTPREKLRDLINFSVKHGAKLVIVDINLRNKTNPGNEGLSKEDQELFDYFKAYPKKPGHTPIILAGTFDVKNNITNSNGNDRSESYVKKFDSFLDDVVTGNCYWAAPTFYKEKGGMIRRMQLWEGPICDGKNNHVFPSIPLLSGALLQKPKGLIKENCDLHHFTSNCLFFECAGNWQDKNIFKRIIYRMPWKLEEDESYPIIQFNGKTPLLKVISVNEILKENNRENKKEKHAKAIKDKIVMIGGSYDDPQDFHETPLGRMPGALIILNAIHSLFFVNINPLCGWLKIIFLTLFVFIISLFFTIFSNFKRMLIFNFIVVFLILLMFSTAGSLFVFQPGVLLDFVIPLAIIGILNNLPLRKFVYGPRKD